MPKQNFPASLYCVSKRCSFVKANICKNYIYFLIDTGSKCSLISNKIFDSLFVNKDLEDLQASLTTADGDLLSVKGKTELSLCINGTAFSVPMVVAHLGSLFGIFGLDFLPKYEAIMDINYEYLYSPYFDESGLVKEDKLHIHVHAFM